MRYLSREDKDSLIRDYNKSPDQTLFDLSKRYGITIAGVSYHITKRFKRTTSEAKTYKEPISRKLFTCTKKDCAYCNQIIGGNKDKLFLSLGLKYKEEEFITITLKSKI